MIPEWIGINKLANPGDYGLKFAAVLFSERNDTNYYLAVFDRGMNFNAYRYETPRDAVEGFDREYGPGTVVEDNRPFGNKYLIFCPGCRDTEEKNLCLSVFKKLEKSLTGETRKISFPKKSA